MHQTDLQSTAETLVAASTLSDADRPGRAPGFAVAHGHAFSNVEVPDGQAGLYRLHDAVLDARTMALLVDGRPVGQTCYLLEQSEHASLRLRPEALIDHADPAPVLIGTNSLCNNYYHWMIQSLPAIDTARRVPGCRIALQPPHNAWQRDSLSMLGLSADALMTLVWDRQYRLPTALYSGHLCGQADYIRTQAAAETFARLCRSLRPPPARKTCIYIARTDAPGRQMRDEALLVERLAGMGVRIVVPSLLCLRDQLQACRDARMVIGPHGAGLSNLIACEAGTICYELISSHYRNSCFKTIADLQGMDYWADEFDSPGPGPPSQRPWAIDVDAVIARATSLARRPQGAV